MTNEDINDEPSATKELELFENEVELIEDQVELIEDEVQLTEDEVGLIEDEVEREEVPLEDEVQPQDDIQCEDEVCFDEEFSAAFGDVDECSSQCENEIHSNGLNSDSDSVADEESIQELEEEIPKQRTTVADKKKFPFPFRSTAFKRLLVCVGVPFPFCKTVKNGGCNEARIKGGYQSKWFTTNIPRCKFFAGTRWEFALPR